MVKSNRERLVALRDKHKLSRVLIVDILRNSGWPNTSKSVVDSYLLEESSPHYRAPIREKVNAVADWCKQYRMASVSRKKRVSGDGNKG